MTMSKRINLTASMLRAYKSCPRLYELQYVEMLNPTVAPAYLTDGSNYHGCVESILKGEPYKAEGKVASMARAFERFIPWREWDVKEIESEFDITLTRFCHMVGKIDAVRADDSPVEHKTTSAAIDEKYINALAWDDQIPFYLLAQSLKTGKPVTSVTYTVCQKPTIKQTQKETSEEYLQRVEAWYDETRVKVVTAVRSIAELKETYTEILEIAGEIRRRKRFYRNPSNCRIMGCSFASICLNYDPQITTGFVKKERMSEELSCNF